MKANNSKLPVIRRAPEVWGGAFFSDVTGALGESRAPFDEYERALHGSASRLVYHASCEMDDDRKPSGAYFAASMLREAALLLDLLNERQNARREP